MNSLIISDLHFTDILLDEYRWGLFNWLSEQIKKHSIKELYILGDLTEKKDSHNSKLVNRLIEEMIGLSEQVEIYMLKGNHDFIDEENPFFKFLGSFPNIHYFCKNTNINTLLGKISFLPYMGVAKYDELKNHLDSWSMKKRDYIFMHETASGSQMSSGIFLNEGIPEEWFSNISATILSGHIHIPQKVGSLEYVGSPYPIYFGDDYEGRAILVNHKTKKRKNIFYPTINRYSIVIDSIKELEELDIISGDQIKIKFILHKGELCTWKKKKAAVQNFCKDQGIVLCSLKINPPELLKSVKLAENSSMGETNIDTLKRFSQLEGLSRSFVRLGKDIITSNG